jgi:Transposase zinc-binding domain/Putative transposase
MALVSPAPCYQRHRPEDTVLYRTLERHLEAFLARASDQGGEGLPAFVTRELRAYLRCGRLEHGCVHVRCEQCGDDMVVAFSCKGRGFCPSCGGRRMSELAAQLVDRVIPRVPVRQWVLSLPFTLRYQLAFDATLTAAVLDAFIRSVFAGLRRAAVREGIADPQGGALTAIQRFGSALNANVHFHSLVLDGVFSRPTPGAAPVFHPLPAPTDEEIAQILEQLHARVTRLLRRCGRLPEDPSPTDPVAAQMPLLAGFAAASIQELIATGPRAGHPVRRLRAAAAMVDSAKLRCARLQGFSLHANVALPAPAREQLEHLCRYVLRPPLATERLTESSGGQLLYEPASRAPRRLHAPAARSAGAHREAQRAHPPAPVSPAPLPRPPGPPRPASLRGGPPVDPGHRARRRTGATPFAAGASEPSRVTGRTPLLGGPDAAGVRGRRSPVQPLRRPPSHCGRLP